MEKLLRSYAAERSAKPALDMEGNLMIDHGEKFVEISWQEFIRKLEKNKGRIVLAKNASEALA